MSPMLRVLLCLGLLSKFSLWAKPGALIPKGKLVTCWCQGSSEALGYRLEKEGTHWSETSYCNGSKASFSLGEMKTETSGRYLCQYWTSSGCSDFSDPLMLIMTGQHDKPVLSAKPSSVVVPGENVTLHCNSSYDVDGFMMSKDQVDEMTPPRPWTIQAKFSIWAVKATDGGTYRCYSFYSNSFYEWSVPSDPLVLRVTGKKYPEDGSLVPQGRTVTLRCRGSQEADLYRLEQKLGNGMSDITDMTTVGTEVNFSLPFVTWNHAGTYYCHYRHSLGWSEPSEPLQLVVTGLYEEPSLAALPSSEVASGQNVTLQCQTRGWHDWFVLYKDGEEITRGMTQSHGRGRHFEFFFPAVTSSQNGTYRCYSFQSSSPNAWSSPSASLVLRVSDAAALDYSMGNLARLILAGLVLILLGVLLTENWKSSRESLPEHCDQIIPQDREKEGMNKAI
uniref:Ig-like domain-containing protein n=1 Tax=Monodelphis domestica TaxID=13616 RepID=F6T023_MONDO